MKGPCAKQVVKCQIITSSGYVFNGENICLTAQEVCPREPDEDYTKCKTICNQVGHAETIAVAAALSKGIPLKKSEAFITGHTRICDGCSRMLHAAGVRKIVITGE